MLMEVPDMNDSLSSIIIDNKEYLLRFTYNELSDCWSFGIYAPDESPILAMTRIVPNYPLNHFYNGMDLPCGIFGAVCESGADRIGRNDFKDGKAQFAYLPEGG